MSSHDLLQPKRPSPHAQALGEFLRQGIERMIAGKGPYTQEEFNDRVKEIVRERQKKGPMVYGDSLYVPGTPKRRDA